MEQEAERLSQEFCQAVLQGQQAALCREGFTKLAEMVGMFHEGLLRTQMPAPLIYILTCNFAAQATERFILGRVGQPAVGEERVSEEDKGEYQAPDVTPA